MTGLRAKQKAKRRELIEDAASKLFVEKGYIPTTIEDVAELAFVSPATVYNYYGTKDALLMALMARGEAGIAESRDDFLARVNTDAPADLVSDVIISNVRDTLAANSRELWGHVVAFIATSNDEDVSSNYLDTIVSNLTDAIERVVQAQIGAGLVKETVDAKECAEVLTRMERIQFLNHIYFRDQTQDELFDAISKDVHFIMKHLIA